MQMSDQRPRSEEVSLGQLVQRLLERCKPSLPLGHFCSNRGPMSSRVRKQEASEPTRTRDELFVQLVSEERNRQAAEEVLEARGDGGEIVKLVEILEVKVLTSLKELSDELRLSHSTRLAVDALVVHACSKEGQLKFSDTS